MAGQGRESGEAGVCVPGAGLKSVREGSAGPGVWPSPSFRDWGSEGKGLQPQRRAAAAGDEALRGAWWTVKVFRCRWFGSQSLNTRSPSTRLPVLIRARAGGSKFGSYQAVFAQIRVRRDPRSRGVRNVELLGSPAQKHPSSTRRSCRSRRPSQRTGRACPQR